MPDAPLMSKKPMPEGTCKRHKLDTLKKMTKYFQ